MAGKTISNPQGYYGVTDAQQKFYYEATEFEAATDITAKQVVYLTSTGTVSPATTSHILATVIGVALNAISSGKVGKVIISGYASGVAASGAITEGAMLKATTAAAVAASTAPAAGECLGFAVAASASSVVDVWISKSI